MDSSVSTYISARIARADDAFGVLVGRAGDSNAHSIGILEIPDAAGEKPTTGWMAQSTEGSVWDRRSYLPGGFLLWDEAQKIYRVAAISSKGSHRKPETSMVVLTYGRQEGGHAVFCGARRNR